MALKYVKMPNGKTGPITADSYHLQLEDDARSQTGKLPASNFARYFIEIENALAYAVQESTEPRLKLPGKMSVSRRIDDHHRTPPWPGAYSVEEVMRHFHG